MYGEKPPTKIKNQKKKKKTLTLNKNTLVFFIFPKFVLGYVVELLEMHFKSNNFQFINN